MTEREHNEKRCPGCGYDVASIHAEYSVCTCPECGQSIKWDGWLDAGQVLGGFLSYVVAWSVGIQAFGLFIGFVANQLPYHNRTVDFFSVAALVMIMFAWLFPILLGPFRAYQACEPFRARGDAIVRIILFSLAGIAVSSVLNFVALVIATGALR